MMVEDQDAGPGFGHCRQPHVPSIKYSLQISQSFFITVSGRYLFRIAFSSHSSTSAWLLNRAGPGLGVRFGSGMLVTVAG